MIADTRKLRQLVLTPSQLTLYLDSLSNSAFRAASTSLADSVLNDIPQEAFWQCFQTLWEHNARAFLGTLLRALVNRYDSSTIDLHNPVFANVCQRFTDIDRNKTLTALIPLMSQPDGIELLFRQCRFTEMKDWIPILIQIPTLPSGFLLLRSLRYIEHDRAMLIRTAHFLMKRGDNFSFNLASLIVASFGLEQVRGTFSLNIPAFQLSRIEQNFHAFSQAMKF